MQSPLKAVVTGGASGIGLAIARGLAAAGYRVLIVDISDSVRQVAGTLPGAAAPVQAHVADLSREADVLGLADHVKTTLEGCDVLVNNAGISPKLRGEPVRPTDISSADWERVLRVNLTAPFLLCRELVPAMQVKGFGRIINIASRAGRTYVAPAGAHYAASKAGLIGLTRHLAGEYAGYGITANCIAPGRIETPLSSTSSARAIDEALQNIPARRLGTPDEIAAVACFLASPGAAYVTGACIDVNGGAFMS
jgi:3-oxoacyl-[acyl-carrier protein] reductase